MFISLPIVDTNPNRGVTYGIMPIWVIRDPDSSRIRQIHAPSLTYNRHFRWVPTYRLYHYPTPLSSYEFRASISDNQDKELMGQIIDAAFLGSALAIGVKLQYDVDGSKRFYGIGPNSRRAAESNFTRKVFHYYARVGVPIFKDTGLRWNVAHHFGGQVIDHGAIGSLPNIDKTFPQDVAPRWNQESELQLFIDYDTRDNAITTSRGSYFKFMFENSQKAFASNHVFQRYGFDLRQFLKHDDTFCATALRLYFEQLQGAAPFYLLPALGGKYTLRGYGTGRYIDKGMTGAGLEERLTIYKAKVAGVITELEVAPFAEIGTVFHAPKDIASRYMRPTLGSAFRAVARPQVVGSIDVGVGQEGAAVFMDINYSF
ncbi:MAG: BamA/TamA family outer membrane protein [Elusimicrobiota bacterium]